MSAPKTQRNPETQGRLDSYADPSQIDKIIKEGAVEFNRGKNPSESRDRILKYFQTHRRMFYVPGGGWYDMMHMSSAYAMSQWAAPENALLGGWGVELMEGLGYFGKNDTDRRRNAGSAFQAEDIRSNRAGAMMWMKDLDVRGVLKMDGRDTNIPDEAEAGKLTDAQLTSKEGRLIINEQGLQALYNLGSFLRDPQGSINRSVFNSLTASWNFLKSFLNSVQDLRANFSAQDVGAVCTVCSSLSDPQSGLSLTGTVIPNANP